jgi:hypothetical protein
MIPDSLKLSLKAAAKELIWLAVDYEPGPRNTIALFCTRRGGSTWLMELLGASRGMLTLNQPLEIHTPNLTPFQYQRMPKFDAGQIIHPDPEDEEALRAYLADVFAGRIRVNAPHQFWRREFQWRTDRLLLKILDAKPMMDWFDANYELDIVYLVRHPIPQALSCMRHGWGTANRAFLRNEWFREEVLTDTRLVKRAESIVSEGTVFERFILNWVLENYYPLKVLGARPDWLAIGYEDCVVRQQEMTALLANRLKLTQTEDMSKVAKRASRSSGLSSTASLAAIASGEPAVIVGQWRDQVDPSDLEDAQAILEDFGISVYSAHSPMPDWRHYGRG